MVDFLVSKPVDIFSSTVYIVKHCGKSLLSGVLSDPIYDVKVGGQPCCFVVDLVLLFACEIQISLVQRFNHSLWSFPPLACHFIICGSPVIYICSMPPAISVFARSAFVLKDSSLELSSKSGSAILRRLII